MGEQAAEAAGFLQQHGITAPRVGLILGSGLDQIAERVRDATTIAFEEIPHFPTSTVAHHSGELLAGGFAGQSVVVMKGRVHAYEGYSLREVTFPVRVMKALGVETLVITSAVGGLHPLYREGDIVAIVDHINLMGDNPLIGPNDDALGPRFPDMSEPYDRALIERAVGAALREGVTLHRGVFAAVPGPNLETRAEYRFLRMIGADVVGMSLVPEDLVAVHAGLRVLALCVVTDMCLPDALQAADIQRILRHAATAQPHLNRIIERVLGDLGGAA
ncbi:MAG: purine-nucleoside phosphorylase [Candidatus Eisenbacteria bacterium]|nr:purine-nucleoside phosphorylase [Candidatus Eisenbacteria bacterium]